MKYTTVKVFLTTSEKMLGVVQIFSVIGYDSNNNEKMLSDYIAYDYFTEEDNWQNDIIKDVARMFGLDEEIIAINNEYVIM